MDDRFDNPQPVPLESLWAIDGVRADEPIPANGECTQDGAEWAVAPSTERLRERLERHDAQVTSALHEAPIPNGLAERVLAAVQQELAARPKSPVQTDAAIDCPRRRISRRTAWIGLTAAVAAAALLAVQYFSPKLPQFTPTSLMEAAIARFAAERNEPPDNSDFNDAPASFPISPDITAERARWRWIDDPWLGQRGVAYDLTLGDDAARATLYVMKGSTEGLISAPPPNPAYPPTQGACAAAWQSGGFVYILVVQGKEAEYQRFLRHPGGPIA